MRRAIALAQVTLRPHFAYIQRMKRNPFEQLRQLYHWVLKWSAHRHNTKALAALSFMESSFFPIPPDALLITMGAAEPRRAIRYALITTIFSVLGGVLGYALGYFFWELTSDFFLTYIFSAQTFEKVSAQFSTYTFVSLFIAALTPIPYKIFTVAGGVAAVPLAPFVAASIVGRGLRFFAVGILIYKFGPTMVALIEKHFEKCVVAFTVLLIGGFMAIKYVL